MPTISTSTARHPSPQANDAGFTVTLPRTAMAATEARRAVTACFEPVLGAETLDDVLLVVSELVTNALLHGHGEIGLRMAFEPHRVTGVVTDEGAAFDSAPLQRDPTRIGGHGLYIVGRVAERWGVGDDAAHVWFEIAAPA